ncbi:MAG: UDP-N-acetylmuramoyl-L-alanine--D-glutamate ligase [Pseudomonadota bacterium]
MKHLADKNVLVLGLGTSGLALARWCARFGATVTVADTRAEPPQLAALQAQVPQAMFVADTFASALVEGREFDLILKSPGLSPADVADVVQAAQARGTAVGNELTLFSLALKELAEPTQTAGNGADGVVSEGAVDEVDEPADTLAQEPPAEVPAPVSGSSEEFDQLLEVDQLDHEAQVRSEDLADAAAAPAIEMPLSQPGYRPKVIAITGTNGKTTVTSLTGQLVARAGKSVAVAGNIGPSLLDTLSDCLDRDALPEVWVLELSSFQLDGVTGFEASAATVLNISQDHLDWHGSMASYIAAKNRIYGSQALMLLNRDDAQVMAALPPLVKGKQLRQYLTFGADEPQRPGDYGLVQVNGMEWLVRAAEADETIKRRKGEETPLYVQRLMPVDALRIRGRHNATNALAALGLAVAAGCAMAPLLHGLREYRGEPHRVESVAIVHDVEYFDDSKGTNVGATVAALTGLGAERRLVVILGGEGKGQDFTPLAGPVSRYARAVVLIGRDAPLLRAALADAGVKLLDAASMEAAVEIATAQAQAGDAVLMSPACASFDMFDNYGHRAEVFCQAVNSLALDAGVVL